MMCFWSLNFGAQVSLFRDHPSKKMKMFGIEKGGIDIVTIPCEHLGKKKKSGMKEWSLKGDFIVCYAKQ